MANQILRHRSEPFLCTMSPVPRAHKGPTVTVLCYSNWKSFTCSIHQESDVLGEVSMMFQFALYILYIIYTILLLIDAQAINSFDKNNQFISETQSRTVQNRIIEDVLTMKDCISYQYFHVSHLLRTKQISPVTVV